MCVCVCVCMCLSVCPEKEKIKEKNQVQGREREYMKGYLKGKVINEVGSSFFISGLIQRCYLLFASLALQES